MPALSHASVYCLQSEGDEPGAVSGNAEGGKPTTLPCIMSAGSRSKSVLSKLVQNQGKGTELNHLVILRSTKEKYTNS
jgi:hypothetical protein